MEIVLGILLLIMAVFLVVSVLLQSSKNHRMSGSIAGGAETFFGKQKGKTLDSVLSKVTTVIAIIFVILVIVIYVIQPKEDQTVTEPDLDTLVDEATEAVIGGEEGEEEIDKVEEEAEKTEEESEKTEEEKGEEKGEKTETEEKLETEEVKLGVGEGEDNEVSVGSAFAPVTEGENE